jgi:hypothetical protein
MNREIFTALGIGIIATVLVVGLTSSIYGQANMTGGNVTGGNVTGGNVTSTDANAPGDDGDDGDDGNDDNNGDN